MAGSYEHLLPGDDDGPGWSMIEHMGDAFECVEELFWLVERGIGREKAIALLDAEFYPMKRLERAVDRHLMFVESQMER